MVSADADGRSERERRLASRAARSDGVGQRQLPSRARISVGRRPRRAAKSVSRRRRSLGAHVTHSSAANSHSCEAQEKLRFPNRARHSPNRVRAVRHPRRRARGSPPTARRAMSTSADPQAAIERVRFTTSPPTTRATLTPKPSSRTATRTPPSRPTRRQHVPATTPSLPDASASAREGFRGVDCEDADRIPTTTTPSPPRMRRPRPILVHHPRSRRSSPPCARASSSLEDELAASASVDAAVAAVEAGAVKSEEALGGALRGARQDVQAQCCCSRSKPPPRR